MYRLMVGLHRGLTWTVCQNKLTLMSQEHHRNALHEMPKRGPRFKTTQKCKAKLPFSREHAYQTSSDRQIPGQLALKEWEVVWSRRPV